RPARCDWTHSVEAWATAAHVFCRHAGLCPLQRHAPRIDTQVTPPGAAASHTGTGLGGFALLRARVLLHHELCRIYLLGQESAKVLHSVGALKPGSHQLSSVEVREDIGFLEGGLQVLEKLQRCVLRQ